MGMNKPLDGTRVKNLRVRRKLTQEKLATLAKVSKESIYRLEKGAQRGTSLKLRDALAAALAVEVGVLTGELPLPPDPAAEDPEQRLFEMFPMNYRVDGAVRNAFTLAALRYRIPIARIVELAPALFVMAAEASLRRRSAKLSELQEALDLQWAIGSSLSHLPIAVISNYDADQACSAEKQSVEQRDILATTLPDRIFTTDPIEPDYDEDAHNPFVASLQAEAEKLGGAAVIERFGRTDTTFHVCAEDALKLAGEDNDLADAILSGRVVIHKMPRELFDAGATEARMTWLREQDEDYQIVLRGGIEPSIDLLGDEPPADDGQPS
jgi:transcriptional regulator with XRE-family HTH domain